MAYIKKSIRISVWNKYGKCCAYCGKPLEYKQLQIDHIEPYWRGYAETKFTKKGSHDEANFNPSCARCNRWKSTWSIDQFRDEIQQQLIRLKKTSSNYRMALDYGMIKEDNKPIEFYFEKYNKK